MEGHHIINESHVGVDGYTDYVGTREVKILSSKNPATIPWLKDFSLIFKAWTWHTRILSRVEYLDTHIFNTQTINAFVFIYRVTKLTRVSLPKSLHSKQALGSLGSPHAHTYLSQVERTIVLLRWTYIQEKYEEDDMILIFIS